MASVFNRGTRDNPKWVAIYNAGKKPDGKVDWRQKVVPDSVKPATKTAARLWADDFERNYEPGAAPAPPPPSALLCGPLIDRWAASITNRSAEDDRSRLRLHVKPTFDTLPIKTAEKLKTIMEWIDAQRAETKLVKARAPDGSKTFKAVPKHAETTIRHSLNLLSRFFGWAVEREYATVNPVRMISQGSRPKESPKGDRPWLQDDEIVRSLFHALVGPTDLMFYVGNRAGLRLGELCGLRLSDLDFLEQAEPVLRVLYQYDGKPLKEDRLGQPKKVKWPPVPPDAVELLLAVRDARLASGAKPDDLLWPCANREAHVRRRAAKGATPPSPAPPGERSYRKEFVEQCWEKAAVAVGLFRVEDEGTDDECKVPSMTFYEATRHSFISRNLKSGVALETVSEAIGHSSPVVTQRYYNHYVRKEYPSAMRAGLGLGAKINVRPSDSPKP